MGINGGLSHSARPRTHFWGHPSCLRKTLAKQYFSRSAFVLEKQHCICSVQVKRFFFPPEIYRIWGSIQTKISAWHRNAVNDESQPRTETVIQQTWLQVFYVPGPGLVWGSREEGFSSALDTLTDQGWRCRCELSCHTAWQDDAKLSDLEGKRRNKTKQNKTLRMCYFAYTSIFVWKSYF